MHRRRRRRGAADRRPAGPRHRARDLRSRSRRCWSRPGCRCASSGSSPASARSSCSLFAIFEPYRRARLTAFLNPWAHAGGAGFQAVQGQIAIGSGGLFGLGPGASVQKIFYLPEAHTDFILAVIGEELGLAGILRPAVAVRHDRVRRAADRQGNAKGVYAKLLAGGLTS